MLAASATLHNLLYVSAALHPDAVAVVEPSGSQATYGALAEYADDVARCLAEADVGEDHFIALFTRKSADAVAAIFGILQSGNAYVPLSADSPPTRLLEIISDAMPSALIADLDQTHIMTQILGDNWSLQCTVRNSLAVFQFSGMSGSVGKNTAYCLYTSGSSGKPKGVVHTHQSALAFVDWCSAEFPISASDRFSSCAPFHFDLSIFDIFVPIKHGSSIALFGADIIRKPSMLAAELYKLAVTILYATPTLFRLLINFGDLPDGYSPKLACFAGELFPAKQLKTLMALWPSTALYNLYGPTETNVCTFHKVHSADLANDQVPIGRACSSDILDLFAVDDTKALRTGELIVSGGSVMTEYWNAPALTDAAFLWDKDRRWYRTGDIVEEIEPGIFRYVGRSDRMIKRRGYRIELNEIELALARNEHLLEFAVVSTVSTDGADVTVTCFFCANDKLSGLQIRKQCAELLPSYMMPDSFFQIESLPKTSTDKVDYMRLKDLVHALAV
jgi:amino acid adenylation domain-containing protein